MTAPQRRESTNWGAYGLDEIWQMVEGESGDRNHDQIRAWYIMAVLCEHHAERLMNAAEKLAERWPPQRNEAAATFIRHLASFAANVEAASQKARLNSTAMVVLTGGLSEARAKIAALRTLSIQYAQAEAVRADAARHVSFVSLDGIDDRNAIRAVTAAGLGDTLDRAGVPSVPDGWREDLDNQARKVMADTDRIVADARTYFRVHDVIDKPNVDASPPSPGSERSTPGLPPRAVQTTQAPPVPVFQPPYPPARTSESGRSAAIDRATLDGTTPTPSDKEDLVPPHLRPGSEVSSPGSGGSPQPAGTGYWPSSRPSATTAMPAGRAIGQRPATIPGAHVGGPLGTSAFVRSGGAAGVADRPSLPIEGVIGGAPASGTGAGATGGRTRRGHANADETWPVMEGVPPIIEPSPEPPHHDPGPNVIGYGR